MRLDQVRVRNYRSIVDSGWVDIETNITTLVGKNESGKTSFLRAIQLLTHDDEVEEERLNQDTESKPEMYPVVSAWFHPEEDDELYLDTEESDAHGVLVQKLVCGRRLTYESVDPLGRGVLLRTDVIAGLYEGTSEELPEELGQAPSGRQCSSVVEPPEQFNFSSDIQPEVESLVSKQNKREPILESLKKIQNGIDPQGSETENHVSSKNKNNKNKAYGQTLRSVCDLLEKDGGVQTVDKFLPQITYDDSVDTIPSEFDIWKPVTGGGSNGGKELTEWSKRILDAGEVDRCKFADGTVPDEGIDTEVDIKDGISKLVNNFWNQKEIKVEIRIENNNFRINIRDKSIKNKYKELGINRNVLPTESRSRGFRWFVSFLLTHAAEQSESDTNSDRLFLFDDPAVYLHPEGKRNWLRVVRNDLSADAQCLYATHSPYLIPKRQLSSVRTVEDTGDGEDENHSGGTRIQRIGKNENDPTTLEPLRKSIGFKLSHSPFVNGRVFLVEGLSDCLILSGVFSRLAEQDEYIIPYSEFTIFPVGGAGEIDTYARFMHSENIEFYVLLDGDQREAVTDEDTRDRESPLETARRKWAEDYSVIDKDQIWFFDRENSNVDADEVEIEHLLQRDLYVTCVKEAYSDREYQRELERGGFDIDDLSDHSFESPDSKEEYARFVSEDCGWKLVDGSGGKLAFEPTSNTGDTPDLSLSETVVAREVERRLDPARNETHTYEHDEDHIDETIKRFKSNLGKLRERLSI